MFDDGPEASLPHLPDAAAYHGVMTLTARKVAAEIRRRQPEVPTVKLHKLMYYAQGHHLATTGRTLFRDTISAWDMGPVVGTLWKAERDGLDPTAGDGASLDEAELNTIGYVLHRYGGMTGRDLIRLSHGEAPWQDADRDRPRGGRVTIPVDSIRSYFADLQTEDDEDEIDLPDEAVATLLRGARGRRETPTGVDSPDEIRRRLHALRG